MDSSPDGAMDLEAKEDVETGDAASDQSRKKSHEGYIKYSFVRSLQSDLQNNSKEVEKKIKEDTPVELETKEKTAETADTALELKKPNIRFEKIMTLIPDLPDWLKFAIAGLAWIMSRRLGIKEDEVQDTILYLLQVLERVAEVTDRLASAVAEALPTDYYLTGAAKTVSQIALQVEKDSETAQALLKKKETAQAFAEMVDDLDDELDEFLNPLIQIGDTFMKDNEPKKENKDEPELSLDAEL